MTKTLIIVLFALSVVSCGKGYIVSDIELYPPRTDKEDHRPVEIETTQWFYSFVLL